MPKLEEYLGPIKTYKKNMHKGLSEEERHMVAEHWGRSFDEWGYDR